MHCCTRHPYSYCLQAARKWGGSGSEKEEEDLDFSANKEAENGHQELAADFTKASLVDQDDDADSDSDLEGKSLCLKSQ